MRKWRNGHWGKDKDKEHWTGDSGKRNRNCCFEGEGDHEAVWASRISFDRGQGQLKIGMSRLAMNDEDIQRWCVWFCAYLATLQSTANLWVGQLDFAENRLTSAGIGHLLEIFSDRRLPIQIIKLHHNRIAEGSTLAAYLCRCEGSLQELHLSHNDLDAQASADIIAAVASAKDADGIACYPRRAGARGISPLWVRLEQNHVDSIRFAEIMDTTYAPLKRPGAARVFCDASSKWCTPHSCAASQQALSIPSVHLKNLQQQRRRTASSSGTDASQRSSRSGSTGLPSSGGSSGSSSSNASASCAKHADGVEVAKILRWDWDVLAWVPDVIEVPPKEHWMEKKVSQTKAEHQENLSLGLKALIGVGMGPHTKAKQSEDRADGDTGSLQRQPASASTDVRSAGATLLRALRGGGSSPSSSLNPSAPEFVALNPQAPEFKPVLSTQAKAPEFKPVSLQKTHQPVLNPKAPAFMPQGLPQAEEQWPNTDGASSRDDTADGTDFSEADWFPPAASQASWESPGLELEAPKPLEPGLQNWAEVKRTLEQREAHDDGPEESPERERERRSHGRELKEKLVGSWMEQLKERSGPPVERSPTPESEEINKQCSTS
eukprot:TRINITY_DN107793_c0_g1_i1.p1 TRINITY_DN107793_c0_g1~~TRINITY_DN107793_c0_g1_i1.p1  ORF type:complete len:605 (-),score=112.73 TRINITY_DN107793_c0_g1_i1:70-1884(-)